MTDLLDIPAAGQPPADDGGLPVELLRIQSVTLVYL